MAQNDPKTVAKLLRAIAAGSDAKVKRHNVILNVAADMLDRPEIEGAEPLFYVKQNRIMRRPVRGKKGTRMGFSVCTVHDGVNPADVCAFLNRGEPAENDADA